VRAGLDKVLDCAGFYGLIEETIRWIQVSSETLGAIITRTSAAKAIMDYCRSSVMAQAATCRSPPGELIVHVSG
jgi:hypothetical protein